MSNAFTEEDLEKEDGYDVHWGTDEEEYVCVRVSMAGSTCVVPITEKLAYSTIPEFIEEELSVMINDSPPGTKMAIEKTVCHAGDLLDMEEFRGW